MGFNRTSLAAKHLRHRLFCQKVFSEVSHKIQTAFKHINMLWPCMQTLTHSASRTEVKLALLHSLGWRNRRIWTLSWSCTGQAASNCSILMEPFTCWFFLLKEPKSTSERKDLNTQMLPVSPSNITTSSDQFFQAFAIFNSAVLGFAAFPVAWFCQQ